VPKRRPKNAIGPTIRKLRYAARVPMSQEALVAKLQIRGVLLDRSALTRIESQDRLVRDVEIIALADALRVPIERLFGR
jgi:transcriptional regulator with XRE-family HTH domain